MKPRIYVLNFLLDSNWLTFKNQILIYIYMHKRITHYFAQDNILIHLLLLCHPSKKTNKQTYMLNFKLYESIEKLYVIIFVL